MADQPALDPTPARRATDLPPDAPWWARWIVANVDQAWKWGSVWWPAVCASSLEIYAQDPKAANEFLQTVIPASWWPHLLAGGFVVSMILRVLNLAKAKPKENP